MTSIQNKAGPIQIRAVVIVLSISLASVGASCVTSRSIHSPIRMADGKQWTVDNLNVNIDSSYCYEDAEPNCRRYGRMYTWESARRGCQSLGDGWRLPTSDEWKQMAKHYGGISDDSDDNGRAAFAALMSGGSSGFNAVLGGNREVDGKYARSEAHGFYWTTSETDPAVPRSGRRPATSG